VCQQGRCTLQVENLQLDEGIKDGKFPVPQLQGSKQQVNNKQL
jgi:hypothetical protein